ncbi:MAG: penicillin-binding protein 1C [Alphaproteobacteria bacterium]|nr:penicillin-binding protein 1C [Alphaproteobacteria bacterium]
MRLLFKKWRSFLTVVAFATVGLFFAIAVTDRLNPLGPTRADDRSVIVTAADGTLLRAFIAHDGAWRLPVHPSQVDKRYLQLLLEWEDQRFESHPGVDPMAVLRAIAQMALKARVVSGASTITMQVARLLEPRERTVTAKFLQMARALQLDWHLSKDQILELYLTLAPYGGNLEGVRAASLAWFGKEPQRLTWAEAALLVALPQSPERRRPDRHPDQAKIARDRVIKTMAARGIIPMRDAQEAMAEPVPSKRKPFPFHAPHLARRLVADNSAHVAVITSTIDATTQRKLEDMAARERAYYDDGANMAIIVVDNATRGVVAYLGGADFWTQQGQVDLAGASRSPGSTLKPFIYGLAFDDSIVHPQTLIDDKPMAFGDYEPKNFDHAFQGTVTIAQALQMSLNVPAVALLDRIGPVRLAATLRNAGADLVFPTKGAIPTLPLALGGVGISLRDLTMLYVSIPTGGEVAPLRYRAGDPQGERFRVFGAAAAYYLFDIMRSANLPDGWSMGQGIVRSRDIAFKTGTSYGYRDAWAMGFSRHYTVGVWVGRADGSTRPGHFGRNEAAPLLLKVFERLPPESHAPLMRPDGAYSVQNAEALPVALQRFRPRLGVPAGLRRQIPPHISFPPNGAVVAVQPNGLNQRMPLKASGGRGTLRWVVNGMPLPAEAGSGPEVWWTPDSEGFARITVVDADGRSDTSQIRLKAEK